MINKTKALDLLELDVTEEIESTELKPKKNRESSAGYAQDVCSSNSGMYVAPPDERLIKIDILGPVLAVF